MGKAGITGSFGASSDVALIRGGQSPKPLAARKAGHLSVVSETRAAIVPKAVPVHDVHGFSAAFPDLWRDYLRAQYRDAVHVAHVFRVSERAARKWLDGVGGPRGASVALALRNDPVASAMLLAA